jgi:CheY-like chemotaxis protein
LKAFVFSRDKLSFEVLERALRDDDFGDVKLLSPSLLGLESVGDFGVASVVFLDLDASDAASLTRDLPPQVPVICIGSHESIKLSAGIAKHILRKPFSKVQVQKVMRAALFEIVRLPQREAIANADESVAVNDLKRRWQQRLDAISARRSELALMLTASTDQLRILLQKSNGESLDPATRLPNVVFPMNHALIVDSSEQNARQLMHSFAAKCVMQADVAEDGQMGWNLLTTGPYDVLVLRWELAQLSGLALYNRIRVTERLRFMPVVILSSKVQAQDFRLLDEDLAVSLLPLPIGDKALSGALSKVVSNAALSREFINDLMVLVREIQSLSSANKYDLSPKGRDYDELVTNALKIVGDRFLDEANFEAAEWSYSAAWRLGDRRLSLVTGYGKACMFLGKVDEAMRLISVADALAPRSVERLCLLGEIELGQRHYAEARLQFGKALAIDPEMKKAEAGILVADALEKQESSGEQKPPFDQFASYLNLIGINLSRAGQTDEAVTYYESAMYFVHNPAQQAKLWFNLGICHLRARMPVEAKAAFEQAVKASGGNMTKAAKYLADSVDSGEKRPSLDFELM